uniref:Activin_recp domain-containing protein n=1 Tax=Steinernema glaseri TaxID=37863 RepID=A0A1I8ANF3_9BILA
MLAKLFVLSLLISCGSSIRCYNENEQGIVSDEDNDFALCVYRPATSNASDRAYGLQFADHPMVEDPLLNIQDLFSKTNPYFHVQSLCLTEVYTISNETAFLHRCICATDLCNVEDTFAGFLHHQHHKKRLSRPKRKLKKHH